MPESSAHESPSTIIFGDGGGEGEGGGGDGGGGEGGDGEDAGSSGGDDGVGGGDSNASVSCNLSKPTEPPALREGCADISRLKQGMPAVSGD